MYREAYRDIGRNEELKIKEIGIASKRLGTMRRN